MPHREPRRQFLGRLSTVSAALAGARALPIGALVPPAPRSNDKWDMSWLGPLGAAKYSAVIDANVLEDGYAAALADGLMGDFQDVHGVPDDQVRIVIVARRLGTPLVLGDGLWERFPIAEDAKLNDRDGKPYRRNPFYRPRAGASPESAATKLESLQRRGVILLVCNIAATNVSRKLADLTKRDVAAVKNEVYAGFVPGTIVVPSGVFAIMRAQNAGCAYMRGQ